MKILPINYQQNSQSFKGLMGSTSVESVGNDEYGIVFETRHYYRFADELNEDTSCLRRAAARDSAYEPWYETGGGTFDKRVSVEVGNLSFTKAAYEAYAKCQPGVPLTESEKLIEDELYSKGLTRHIPEHRCKVLYDAYLAAKKEKSLMNRIKKFIKKIFKR